MNRNAANAVLKILEEPPSRALLLLVSHNPGRLLPTIRSRCRRLMLTPPAAPIAAELIRRFRPQLDEVEAAALAAVCAGSIGRALELADSGGLALYRSVLDLLSQAPAIDIARLHGFADRFARADAEDAYRASAELLSQVLSRLTARAARGALDGNEIVAGERAAMQRLAARADPARWSGLRTEIERRFVTADELNLDRKQTMLGAFFAIAEMSR
jgi:DNA polymerase-3 subunit delta'